MANKRYTDEEIVRALECCLCDNSECLQCGNKKLCEMERNELAVKTLDLINRKMEEIERLKKEVSVVRDAYISIQDRYEYTKAEAYKEFAERIKEYCSLNDDLSDDAWLSVTADIDCALKEMVGESNGI